MKHQELFQVNLVKYHLSVDKFPQKCSDRIQYTCQVCQYSFTAQARKLTQQHPTGCARCSNSTLKSSETIDRQLPTSIVRIGDYLGAKRPMLVSCQQCQHQWQATPDNLINQHKQCPPCAQQRRKEKNSYSTQQITQLLVDKKFDLLTLQSYQQPAKLQCLHCHHIQELIPARVINDQTGCVHCKLYFGIRKNERLIKQFLSEHNISYVFDYPLKLEGIDTNYKIDFYFPQTRMGIEYNGSQHYQPESFGSKTRNAEQEFIKQQLRDQQVRDICEQVQIKLITIDGRTHHGKKLRIMLQQLLLTLRK